MVAALKFTHDDKGKTTGICSEKKETKQMEGTAVKSHFPYWCGKNPVNYDDPSPSPAFNIILQLNPSFQHFSIQSLVQKKTFESAPRTWAMSFPRRNFLPSR